jgi:uncharacterized protein YyaL (SSP411 family)
MTSTSKGSKNHLAGEKSPYLLQHADNPVEWYPWSEEAFERAREEDKPIFLSIGYSTCHWCHVMAHESFEDAKVAALMNDAFVSIKVDREERPDIDKVYMTVAQMVTGSGGWPLTVVMTPDKKPFLATTYVPKETRFGRVGMLELVPRIQELWTDRREELLQSAEGITTALTKTSEDAQGPELGEETIEAAFLQLGQRFDEEQGGFGGAPKFPTPHNLTFLLRYWKRKKDEWALKMVTRTLDGMRMGGIYDHVGLGFHRYSTDGRWLLPHFEKMLYDQALLVDAYTEAYLATGDEAYKRTAKEVINYVLSDLRSTDGAFYSAEDADSEGVEGKFYVWTEAEVREVLEREDADLAMKVFTVDPKGNFREEASRKRTGANVLHLARSLPELSTTLNIPEKGLSKKLEHIRRQLLAARQERVRPHLDDKVLADWNGLMIAALAKASSAFDEPEYGEAAMTAARFVLERMRTPEGRLVHRFREGETAHQANLDDYAFMVWGLIELYEATFDVEMLQVASELNQQMLDHFWDPDGGGLFFTPDDGEELLVRQKEIYDGAIPSGNSVAMLNLLRLGRMLGDAELEERAAGILRAFSTEVGRMPSAFTQFVTALDFALGPSHEVVIVGDPDAKDTRLMLEALRKRLLPNKVLLFKPSTEERPDIAGRAPFLEEHHAKGGKATAYVCEHHFCHNPTTDVDKMLEELGV